MPVRIKYGAPTVVKYDRVACLPHREPALLQLNHPQPSADMLQTNASPKPFDEKLRNLMERATALKQAVAESKRRAQFERDWDKLPSVPSPFGSSEALKDRVGNQEKPGGPIVDAIRLGRA